MTEAEWLGYTDTAMLWESDYLWRTKQVNERKYRLFAAACCRRIWNRFHIDLCRRAVEVSERYADGQSAENDLESLGAEIEALPHGALTEDERWLLGIAASHAWDRSYRLAGQVAGDCAHVIGQRPEESEERAQCDIIRDMFPGPFRQVAFDPAWRTSDVMALANGIYAERAFDRMPILADALQDAGCDSADILGHLRDEKATHVRGCWALDLVLGKE